MGGALVRDKEFEELDMTNQTSAILSVNFLLNLRQVELNLR